MVELVNTVTSERIDLRFVDGLSIKLVGDVPPEVRAAFEEMAQARARWQQYVYGALGVPAKWLAAKKLD